MASFRANIVGTKFGIRLSTLRRSRGCVEQGDKLVNVSDVDRTHIQTIGTTQFAFLKLTRYSGDISYVRVGPQVAPDSRLPLSPASSSMVPTSVSACDVHIVEFNKGVYLQRSIRSVGCRPLNAFSRMAAFAASSSPSETFVKFSRPVLGAPASHDLHDI